MDTNSGLLPSRNVFVSLSVFGHFSSSNQGGSYQLITQLLLFVFQRPRGNPDQVFVIQTTHFGFLPHLCGLACSFLTIKTVSEFNLSSLSSTSVVFPEALFLPPHFFLYLSVLLVGLSVQVNASAVDYQRSLSLVAISEAFCYVEISLS